jgi:hypothetical protein
VITKNASSSPISNLEQLPIIIEILFPAGVGDVNLLAKGEKAMLSCPWGCTKGSEILDSRKLTDTVQRVRRCKQCKKLWDTWEVEQNIVEELRRLRRFRRRMEDAFEERYKQVNRKPEHSRVPHGEHLSQNGGEIREEEGGQASGGSSIS